MMRGLPVLAIIFALFEACLVAACPPSAFESFSSDLPNRPADIKRFLKDLRIGESKADAYQDTMGPYFERLLRFYGDKNTLAQIAREYHKDSSNWTVETTINEARRNFDALIKKTDLKLKPDEKHLLLHTLKSYANYLQQRRRGLGSVDETATNLKFILGKVVEVHFKGQVTLRELPKGQGTDLEMQRVELLTVDQGMKVLGVDRGVYRELKIPHWEDSPDRIYGDRAADLLAFDEASGFYLIQEYKGILLRKDIGTPKEKIDFALEQIETTLAYLKLREGEKTRARLSIHTEAMTNGTFEKTTGYEIRKGLLFRNGKRVMLDGNPVFILHNFAADPK